MISTEGTIAEGYVRDRFEKATLGAWIETATRLSGRRVAARNGRNVTKRIAASSVTRAAGAIGAISIAPTKLITPGGALEVETNQSGTAIITLAAIAGSVDTGSVDGAIGQQSFDSRISLW